MLASMEEESVLPSAFPHEEMLPVLSAVSLLAVSV